MALRELLQLLLLLLVLVGPARAVEPKTSNSSVTVDGELLSVTSWHARTLTNVSWEIPLSRRNATHLIVVTWDEEATEEAWWPPDTDTNSRAESPPSSTTSSTYFPSIGEDLLLNVCTYSSDAFDSPSSDAFVTDANRALVSVDLADERTWWFIASLGQDKPNATSSTSGVGQASVLLSEPGFYTACMLLVIGDDETCPTEECVDVTVYQPPNDFLEVRSQTPSPHVAR